MTKKVWNKEAFQAKNSLRKLYKEKNHASYLSGRRTRKELSVNGCFGQLESKKFNELALGTSGFRD